MITLALAVLLMAVGGIALSATDTATTTYPFDAPINGLWQYNSGSDVYYIVGIVYCGNPSHANYQQMGIFVPGAYMNATSNNNGTYTCTINPTASLNG